ncbi:MAG TPA: mandelate racemase/muconate lactonizing enzyme family protein [Streptosporangiaceae bacterium]|nr:mandelate racemase/muconate lactonizing enzyme family protein [Streptosporangiaceae bacterium]
MTLTHINARAVRIPVGQPTRMSTRLLDKRDYLLVTVEDDDTEEVGVGYAYAGTTGGRLLVETVDELLQPLLKGADPGDIIGHWERMYQETLLAGRRGGVLRAMSAVDIALWDLAAKRHGVPLSVLLGGHTGATPAYASGGYYQPEAGAWTDAVTREIKFNQSLGFRDHKIKVGGLSPEQDAERVRAAIEAIGGQGRLALDVNNAYRSVAEATRAVRIFERAAGAAGLWWVEEPLSPDDVAGHAVLAKRVESPIATGEIAQTRWEFRDLLGREAADILQPDAGVVGGVTEWMRVVRTAETFGVSVAPHWHANVHVHLAAASTNCIAVEHFALEKDIYNFELLITPETRLAATGGQLLISDRPGIGIELDPDAIEKYALPL